MKKGLLQTLFSFIFFSSFGQGLNSHWPIGYYSLGNDPNQKARLIFNSSSYLYQHEYRKMNFDGTQATIADLNGNFLMSSNGVWVANANNDTMMNGSELNPGYFVNGWPSGLPIFYGNILLPFPGDSTKYVLFHQTELDPDYLMGIYKSEIDITLDNGLGGLINKNDTLVIDSLSWGIAACKHANGRDWWIVFMKDSSDLVYKILLTPNGIDSITTQPLNFLPRPPENGAQITFTQDGKKFIYTTYDDPVNRNSFAVLCDFDRCTGTFSNTQVIPLTANAYLWGLAFSSSGDYLYACSSNYIFQINTNTMQMDTVATYDGFSSPFPPFNTTFFNMYLAANGKIYITSGNSTSHLHFINYPDSAGISCDVQQHALDIDSVRHFRAVPNHPNYYLGCDTTGGCPCYVGIEELDKHDFKFSISPNPNNGSFKIIYLLPQNKKGTLEMFDINGRKVYSQTLPQWSTLQQINLPGFSNGLYNCVLTSGNERVSRKVAVLRDL